MPANGEIVFALCGCYLASLNRRQPGLRNLNKSGNRRRGNFLGHKSALLVRAVAERFSLRLTAATQGDGWFVVGDWERIAQVINDRHRTFDDQRAIQTTADPDLGHLAECGVRSAE
jgi:hypothetical protein